MFSTQQQPTRGPWGLAALLALALAPSPAHSGNVYLRNDSKMPVVIHACSIQGKQVLRAKPCLLDPKSTSPALTLPGNKVITIYDGRFPTRRLFQGTIPANDTNLYFSIKPGIPAPRVTLQAIPAPPEKP